MAYELNFDIRTNGLTDAQKIEAIVAAIGKTAALTSGQLGLFESVLKADVAAGNSLNKSLADLAQSGKSVGQEIAGVAAQVQKASTAQQEHAASATKAGAAQQVFAETTRQTRGAVDEATKGIFNLNKEMDGATKGFALGALGLGAVGGIGLQVGRQLASGLVGSLKDVVEGTAEYARTIDNLSQRTGLSIAESQRYTQIADIAGVSVGSLTGMMRSLSRGLADGTVEGKQQRLALQEMGISAEDAQHNLKPIGTIIQEIGTKLSQMQAGPNRDFFANTVLGRGGIELLPAITRMDELGAAVNRAGAIMDTEGVRAAERYGVEINVLKLTWEALKRSMADPIIGIVKGIPDPSVRGPQFRGADQNVARQAVGQAIANDPQIAALNNDRRAASTAAFNANPHLRLEEAQKQFAQINAKNIESGTTDPADIAKWEAARQKVEQISKEISAIKSDSKEIAKAWEDLGHRRDEQNAEGSDIAKAIIAAKQDAQNAPTSALKQGYADLNTSNIHKLAEQELQKNAQQVLDSLEKASKAESEAFLKQLGVTDKNLSTEHANLSKAINEWKSARKAEDAVQVSGVRDTAERQSKLLSLSADPGTNSVTIALQQLAITQQAIQAEAAILEKHKDIYNMDVETARLQKQKNDAQFAFLDAVAAKQKAQNEAFANSAVGLLHSIESGKTTDFFKSIGNNLADQVVKNAAGLFTKTSTYQNITGALHGVGNGGGILGKLLAGTPFEADPLKGNGNTVSLDKNTGSLDLLTGAVGDLFSAITGNSVPGVSTDPGALNPTGGLLGGLFSGGGVLGSPGGIFGVGTGVPGFGALGSSTEFGALGLPQLGGLSSTGLGIGSLAGLASGTIQSAQSGGITGALSSLVRSGKGLSGLFGGGGDSGQDFSDSGFTDAMGNNIPDIGLTDPNSNSDSDSGDDDDSGGFSAGGALAVGGGALAAYNGFSKGGTRGDLQGVGGALASAAGIASMIPGGQIVGLALGIGSAITGLIGGLLGDPRQERANQISKELGNAKYEAPVAINETVDQSGNYQDYGQYGQVRSSPFRGTPMVSQPYQWYHNGQYLQYPGEEISPFQNPDLVVPSQNLNGGVSPSNPEGKGPQGGNVVTPPAYGPQTIINVASVQSMDSKSFGDFLTKSENLMQLAKANTAMISGGHGSKYQKALSRSMGLR